MPSRSRTWVALAICAAAYLYAFPYYPEINNPNENVRLYMTAAIVERGTYRINALRERWGWVNDAAVRDGNYYSVKAPGTSLLGVPGYALYDTLVDEPDQATATWVVRVTGTIVPMLLFFVWLYRWLGARARDGTIRDATFLSIALGSGLLGYGLLFVSHSPYAASGFGAFMLLHDARRRGSLGIAPAFGAGLLTAGVTLLEYPGIVGSVVLSVYALTALRPWRRLVPFAAGGLIPTLTMMHFQWAAYGSPWTPGHRFLENAALRQTHRTGFFGASHFHPEAASGLLIDLRWGLVLFTPIVLLSLLGLPKLLRDRSRRTDALAALVLCLGTYVAICFMENWRGGWSIGPRYLTIVVPFLAWMALVGLDGLAARRKRLAGGLALGAAAAGLVASGIPSLYYPHIPPDLAHPFPQLFSLLIAHDYAPYNAGNLVHWYRTASMVPLLLLAVLALGWALGAGHDRRSGAVTTAIALLCAVVALAPHFWPAERTGKAAEAVAFVTRHWTPEGHDRAARLDRYVHQSGRATFDDWRRLADLYFEEGRTREARETMRELDRKPPTIGTADKRSALPRGGP